MGQKASRESGGATLGRLAELETQCAQLKTGLAASNAELWQAVDALEEQVQPQRAGGGLRRAGDQ